MARVQVNRKAPRFTLIDVNGVKFSPADYEGKNLILLVFNRGFT